MVTGKKAFEGEGHASLIASIMHVDPPAMSTLQSMTPPALDHVVQTCLAKKPDDRCQTAGEVGRQLTWITEGGSQPNVAASVSVASQQAGWRQAVPGMLAALVVGSLITALAVWSLTRPDAPRVARFPLGAALSFADASSVPWIAVSPDGTRVVYVCQGRSKIRPPWRRETRPSGS